MRRGPLLLALVTLAAAAPPPVPAYREFGRWLVVCDNGRACVVRGFGEATQAQLQLDRAAGDGRARLSLAAGQPFARDEVSVDGRRLDLPTPAWSEQDGGWSTDDPAAVRSFVDSVRDRHALALGAPAEAVPLEGLAAALRVVDAIQGRPGTPTALVSVRGTAALPPAPPLPRTPRFVPPPPLGRTETQRLLRAAGRLRSPMFDPCSVAEPPAVYALDARFALAIRPCYQAAYQSSSVVAVLPRAGGAARPLVLAYPGLPKPETTGPDMTEPEFDPASGTLHEAAKGRGLADCGLAGEWVWSAGAFRLTAFRYQAICGGTEPGDWPLLYRTLD